ncbi:MAG: hypothetical protein EBT48_05165 [Verrucomicrobia bacterium]|nr:hypothetical protein [Verrucomicrobiota bacterium]
MIQIAIKKGRVARLLSEYIPDLELIPSHTKTEDFPNGKITIRTQRWHPERINDPNWGLPLLVRLTYKDTVSYIQGYDGTRKIHFDLAYDNETKEWTVLPALSQGRLEVDLFARVFEQLKTLASILKAITQKGI